MPNASGTAADNGAAIVIIIAETKQRNGMFDAHVDGRYLLTSREPYLDGARVLIAQGRDPAATLIMRRSADGINCLVSPLGVAAQLTVNDSSHGRPLFRRFRPPLDGVAAPPVAATDSPLAQVAEASPSAPAKAATP